MKMCNCHCLHPEKKGEPGNAARKESGNVMGMSKAIPV